jgi:hypothetical protein
MRTSRAAAFLLLLLFWAQVDDAWIPSPIPQSQVPVDDDDEYLPARREQDVGQRSDGQRPVDVGPTSPIFCLFSTATLTDVAFAALLSQPLGRASLYVFMSLQR